MARISINNLQADDFNSSLISLGDQETDLVKAAVERALDARNIQGSGLIRPPYILGYFPIGEDRFIRIGCPPV